MSPSLGMMPGTLHFQAFSKKYVICATMDVYPNMTTSSAYTMKKPTTSLLKLETTFHTFFQ
eukprot:2691151-Prorocentrum_lima.AAC.1